MRKKLGGSALSREKPPTYQSRTTSRKEVVPVAPLTVSERGEPHAEYRELIGNPVALYRLERDRRAERSDPRMLEAKAMYARLLEADRTSQKGGRPRKIVNVRRSA